MSPLAQQDAPRTAPRRDRQEMDGYSAVRWNALSNYGNQGMRFGISLVLARLLSPEHFGLMGMAFVVTGFAQVFRDLGFHTVIIQRKEIDDRLLSTIFWVILAVCVALSAILAGSAPWVAWGYGDPRVAPLVAVLSLDFLLGGLAIVPTALLTRELSFRKLALRDLGGTVVMGLTGVALALTGHGVWALVAGTLAGSATRVVLINAVSSFRPRLVFDWQDLKECYGFGLNVTGFSIVNYFARRADNLIIGMFLGASPLAFYSFAYKLMLLPRDSMSNVVGKVLFPKLSRVQDDDRKISDTWLRTVGAISYLSFPMMVGIALVAEPFVKVVLGSEWLPAVPLVWLLAPVGMIHSVLTTTGQLFLVKGKSRWMLAWGSFASAVLVASFLCGLPWGVQGVTASYAIANLLIAIPGFSVAFRTVQGLTLARLLRTLAPNAVNTALMSLIVVGSLQGCRLLAPHSSLAQLIVCVATGIGSYGLLSLLFRPEAFRDVVAILPLPTRWTEWVRCRPLGPTLR